ncbi:hypothetical protein KP509_39G005800 [Ceratopteris richardii]|uniref:Uncharacterized protein n=1 Tax=Ceratopteris richardii TaxID=49495 RepID=A0A8T2PXP7_CERRI|nr:hypothetical protein KP509_39G005800 [Ceratopteris richardii]KAH7276408.1 hypothetical protein KP509_39G005800 [Ceratopteris richardii]
MDYPPLKSSGRRRAAYGMSCDQDIAGPVRVVADNFYVNHYMPRKGHRRSSSVSDMPSYLRHMEGSSPRFPGVPRFLARQLSESDLAKCKPTDGIDYFLSTPACVDEAIRWLGLPQVLQADNNMSLEFHSGHARSMQEHAEGQVEEKIIRAVHAQPMPKPAAVSGSQNNLYNIIREEVFEVVADMKEAIEMSQEKASISDMSAYESTNTSCISLSEEIVEVFRYVCKGYAARIEKAEQQLDQLRAQLAEKEQTCLELMAELKSSRHWEHETASRKEDYNRRISNGINWNEGGTIRTLQESILEDEVSVRTLSGQEIMLELEKEIQDRERLRLLHTSSSSDCINIEKNIDGLMLPWLTSCAEMNNSAWELDQANAGQVEELLEDPWQYAHHLCQAEDDMWQEILPEIEDNIKWEESHNEKQHLSVLEGDHLIRLPLKSMTCDIQDSSMLSSTADSSLQYVQSMELISEKIQFRTRVQTGELILCIGTLHIH